MILWSAWWGGLSLYAIVVVPIGTDAIGSVAQGFITQKVTQWHNALFALLLLALFFDAFRRRMRSLWIITGILALILVALVIWHARLTGMMDFKNRTVPNGFYAQHAVYLWLIAVEWGVGMIMPLWVFPRTFGKESCVCPSGSPTMPELPYHETTGEHE